MQIILFLIILSLLVAGGFLMAFFWAVRDGQYDDDVTPSIRILIDDDMLDVEASIPPASTGTASRPHNSYVEHADI